MAQLVLYGSNVSDATLTNACDMAVTSGGVETSAATSFASGTGNFGEFTSKGTASGVAVASIPATPTGKGWVYKPGAGTFAAGTWAPILTLAGSVNNGGNQTFRIFTHSGGIYTLVGSITFTLTTAAKTTYTLTPTAMPSVALAATDFLYFDLWYQNNTGAASDTATVYESTTASQGVTNDFQVTTASFTASLGFQTLLYLPYAIPRALGGAIIPQVVLPPVIYEPRALGSTLLTDPRLFIPRALGGTYIQDDPTLLWVPHALGGTTQVLTSVALASTIHAIGLESTALSLSTTLTVTLPGVGILAPTLTARLDLGSVTLPADGVLTPSGLTESTALAGTLSAVGVLSGTPLASLDLGTATIPAVGTLTGTFTEATALAVTIPAVGIITGSLSTSANVSLAVTIPAVGTLTMAGAALSTALAASIPAVGILTPVLSASIGLPSSTIPAVGTLVGTLVASAPLSSTVAGVGTLSATMASSTSLTGSLSAVGTLAGTLTVGNSVSFAVTIPAVGTLPASAPTFKTALTASIAALGTIVPGATFSEALSGTTLVAAGTLSGSASLAVILAITFSGVGVISGAYQVRTALSLQLMAIGVILGTLRVPATFFGPYSATESTLNKLTSSHTVTSKTSSHIASTYTAVRK